MVAIASAWMLMSTAMQAEHQPFTFKQWQVENPLNGQNGPLDNPDADRWNNALEFALGQAPDSGLDRGSGFLPRLSYNGSTQKFDFEFQRSISRSKNVTFTLLAAAGSYYSESTLKPVVEPAGADLETVTYADVESDTVFASMRQGSLCLSIRVQTGAKGSVSSTPSWFWRRHDVAAGGSRSFAMPLMRQEILQGHVTALSGAVLEVAKCVGSEGSFKAVLVAGESYYLEVIGGPLEGQRWEVDEAASTDTMIALDLTSSLNTRRMLPDLSGHGISVRPHQTVAQVVRMDRLQAATRPAQADRLQFWDRQLQRYSELWLCLHAGNDRSWVQSGDSPSVSSSARVISPGEGLFIHARSLSAFLPLVGLLRETDLVLDLAPGTHFVSTGCTSATSPTDQKLTDSRLFTQSPRSAHAERLRIWSNQAGAQNAYTSYYLAGKGEWLLQGDADQIGLNVDQLLPAFAGFFLIHPGAQAEWRQSSPPSPEILPAH